MDLLLGVPGVIGSGSYAEVTVPLEGVTASVAISPQYLTTDWAAARYPTVRVEKGYGSGTYQNLYPDPGTGELFTAANGGGQSATAFAAGEKLLVEIPYNQALSDPDHASQPSVITDDSRRVLLDISTPTAPSFAGYQQGTQDASQHATERGYDLKLSVANNAGFTMMALDNAPSTGTTQYDPFRSTSRSLFVQPNINRWYDQGIVAVATLPSAQHRKPSLKISHQDEEGIQNTKDYGLAIHGGAYHENAAAPTVSGTAVAWYLWGTTNSLTGRSYGAVIIAGSYLTPSQLLYSGDITKRMYGACRNIWAADEVSVMGPLPYHLFPMSLSTETATLKIICASGPNRAIEASFNGESYQTIGTTDANGYLVGSYTGAGKGTGTLNVRVVGQTTLTSVANVRVGIYVAMLGQSNAIGRGDNVILTANRTVFANTVSNSTATQKSWMWAFAQNLATEYSCPIAMGGWAAGATYLYFDTGGSSDGSHGHWNEANAGAVVISDFRKAVQYFLIGQEEPNITIWHQGESEAASGNGYTLAKYKPALVAMWEGIKERTGLTGKLHLMQIGRVGTTTDSQVDTMRQTLWQCVADRPGLFEYGGCLAHLPVEDTLDSGQNVHFYTVAQKTNVVNVFKRHALGSGRGPRYSSMVASGTTITITCTGGVSPLTIDAGEEASPIGWTVTDGGGSNAVTAVSVSGLVITLTVTSTVSGTVTVKWLSHYSGIGTTILDSDATTPVPPEPFEQSVASS